jgi:predicted SAM-dependent methyltransferase
MLLSHGHVGAPQQRLDNPKISLNFLILVRSIRNSLYSTTFNYNMHLQKKLNFGCGDRFSSNWVNIDFHSKSKCVQRVNLLDGFPFPDNYFDAVYSSHVIEHFDPDRGLFLVKESYRVLRPGGTIRIVVPDLENSCREYLRILSMDAKDLNKPKLYSWIMLELLDQLVRTRPSGRMRAFVENATKSGDAAFISYIISRTQSTGWEIVEDKPLLHKIKNVSPEKLFTKLLYLYLKGITRLIPKNIRSMVFIETGIGERHRWMYDSYSLSSLLQVAGFVKIKSFPYNQSAISDFNLDQLDCDSFGAPYKNNSLYFEGQKV